MELKSEFIIEDNIVSKVTSFCGIDVYTYSSPLDCALIHYFVKDNKVVAKNTTEADCGQNVGYISNNEWYVDN